MTRTIELAGESVTLDAARALVWKRNVVIADPHFGKDATARALAIPVPHGTTVPDLGRLDETLERHDAKELWMLGDVFDSRHSREPETLRLLVEWRGRNAHRRMLMVAGNHDRRALDLAGQCGFEILPDLSPIGPWRLSHEPTDSETGYVLCGHLHPGLRMQGAARESLRLPAFLFCAGRGVLPAFGSITGLEICSLAEDDRGYVLAGAHVFGPFGKAISSRVGKRPIRKKSSD